MLFENGKSRWEIASSALSPASFPPDFEQIRLRQRPNVVDLMKNKDVALGINTPSGKTREDEVKNAANDDDAVADWRRLEHKL